MQGWKKHKLESRWGLRGPSSTLFFVTLFAM